MNNRNEDLYASMFLVNATSEVEKALDLSAERHMNNSISSLLFADAHLKEEKVEILAISVGQVMLDDLTWRLKPQDDSPSKESEILIQFSEDDFTTVFKWKEDKVWAYDPLHPEGRIVLGDPFALQGIEAQVPLSLRGVLMKHMHDMNSESGGLSDSLVIATAIESMLADRFNRSSTDFKDKIIKCVAAAMMSKELQLQVIFARDSVGFAYDKEMAQIRGDEVKIMTTMRMWAEGLLVH